jgi:putative transposase
LRASHDYRSEYAAEIQAVVGVKNLRRAECIRPGTPLSLEDALRLVEGYVEHYNNVRLNSAIGYITPKDVLAGHQHEIQAERDRKLEVAREQRKNRRQRAA